MACEGSASDITLAAKAPPHYSPIPPPSQVKGIICCTSCQVWSWKTLISLADGARGLMSITQALKQELTWTWSDLSALWQHYLTPRTSAVSFSVSLHLFICFPPATPLRSLLSLFSEGIVMSRVEIPVKKKKNMAGPEPPSALWPTSS